VNKIFLSVKDHRDPRIKTHTGIIWFQAEKLFSFVENGNETESFSESFLNVFPKHPKVVEIKLELILQNL